MIDGFQIAFENMGAGFCFVQFKPGASSDDFDAMFDPCHQDLLDIHDAWKALIQRQHVAAEGHLQIGKFIELVDGDFRDFTPFQFDDNAYAVFIRFIAQIGNAGDRFIIDQVGNLFNQTRFIDVIRNFIDDKLTVVAIFTSS